tara:strand:- start:107 stop:385 length:279 start_codon:yes stop_codon:yes gene_type:complete
MYVFNILLSILKKISFLFDHYIRICSLLRGAFNLMRNRENIEDLITSSLKQILSRSLTLEKNDQIAISQEFKEWIHGVTKEEDIWVINHPIK